MVTLGEFLDAAARDVDAAEVAVVAGPVDRVGVLPELRRLVMVLGRYLDDVLPGTAGPGQSLRSWERLVAQQREGLRQADRYLAMWCGVVAPGPGVARRGDERVRGLARAVDALSAGRELMGTHYEAAPDGGRAGRSRWARLMLSEPVVVALAVEVSGWCDVAASWTRWVAATQPDVRAREALGDAGLWLSVAAKATGEAGGRAEAVAGRDLLCAVPLCAVPGRVRPHPGEDSAGLCRGIIAGADRLRMEAFARAGPEPGPRLPSGPAWQRTAQACAITADLACRAMEMLAERAAQAPGASVPMGELRDAAAALAGACEAWKALTRLWKVITTDTQDAASPVTIDVSDLALRLGRLVWGEPRWTPAWREAGPPDAGRLAADEASLRMVLAAAHHAIDAVGFVARADADGVRAAERASRLYMPARVLGEVSASGRPYRIAPADRVFLLQAAYQSVVDSCDRAARVMDGIAGRSGLESRVLALARAACPTGDAERVLRVQPDVLAAALQGFGRPAGSQRPHVDGDAPAIVSAYLNDGLTILECTYVFGRDPSRISAILQANGVTLKADRGRDARPVAPESAGSASAGARRAAEQPRLARRRGVIQPPGNRGPRVPGRTPSPLRLGAEGGSHRTALVGVVRLSFGGYQALPVAAMKKTPSPSRTVAGFVNQRHLHAAPIDAPMFVKGFVWRIFRCA
jgi:hypothetical protein